MLYAHKSARWWTILEKTEFIAIYFLENSSFFAAEERAAQQTFSNSAWKVIKIPMKKMFQSLQNTVSDLKVILHET